MPRDPFGPLRWRLARRFASLAGAILVVGGASLYLYVRHAIFEAADGQDRLAIISLREGIDTAGPLPVVDAAEFAEEVAEVSDTLGILLVQVWSADGRLLARDAALRTEVAPDGPERALEEVEGHQLVLHRAPLAHDGANIGTLVVGRRADDMTEDLETLARGLFLGVPLVLLASLAAGWLLSAQALRPARRAFEQQRAFISDASHELRTPLAIIQAQAEVALDAGREDPERLATALGVVGRTVRQAAVLVDDMLFLSRSDADAAPAPRRPFRLDLLAEESVDAFQPLAEPKGLRLVLEAPAEGVEVVADPDQLQRLLGILLDNTIRHADPGEVRVVVAHRADAVSLRVEDAGPGMSPELVARAFDRFVRGDGARTRENGGHGLGLAIAKAIVEAHGGALRLTSGIGRGSVVEATFPSGTSAV